jgi:hypothetical protein
MIKSEWIVADITARNALTTTWADVLLGNECFVQSTSAIYRAVRSGTGATVWRASDVESEFDADEVGTALAGTDTMLVKTAAGSYVTALLSRIATYVATALNVTSGTWAPTVTATSNLDGTPTVDDGYYIRVGSIVVFICRAVYDATTGAGTSTEFRLTFPVTTNLSASTQCLGVVTGQTVTGGRVLGEATVDLIRVLLNAGSTSSDSAYVMGLHRVI